jgi:uncharacterized protein (UPF0332 family)
MKEFPQREWQRADRALKTAAMLIATDPEAAVNRAYYAVFHALTAIFALGGQSFTKHSALRAAVHKDLVKAGEWPMDLGKDYDLLTSLRQAGDYGGVTQVSEQDARRAVEAAERIIAACREKLSSLEENS